VGILSFDIEDIKNFAQFGQYLKNSREQQHISIEQIHKETKIRTKYLAAMENGDFSSIPGGDVYVKGFLKNYAKCVGLEPSSIIELYKKLRGDPKEEESPVKPTEETISQLDVILNNVSSFVRQNYRKIGVTIIATSFVIVLGISLKVFVGKNISENQAPPPKVPTIQTQIQNEAEKKVEEPKNEPDLITQKNKEVMVELVEDTSQNTIYAIDAEYIEVTMSNVTDRCWIQVLKDGEWEFEGILNSGDSKTWKANDSINIRIGNPAVINLVVNGEDLGKPGGIARDFIFKRRASSF